MAQMLFDSLGENVQFDEGSSSFTSRNGEFMLRYRMDVLFSQDSFTSQSCTHFPSVLELALQN